jgi:multidrug efflux pump
MFSRFFVRRPVFAWVIAILIMLAGVLAIRTPAGRPVSGRRSAGGENLRHLYRGVRETLENSVTRVIEQQLTGLDHLLYFSSTSGSDETRSASPSPSSRGPTGHAQVQVQNKVQQAESRLPSEVQQSGVTVEKSQATSC